jgi:hypothetical protein
MIVDSIPGMVSDTIPPLVSKARANALTVGWVSTYNVPVRSARRLERRDRTFSVGEAPAQHTGHCPATSKEVDPR